MTIENKVWKPNKWSMFKTLEQDIKDREELRGKIKPLRDEIRLITRKLANQKIKWPELIEKRKELYEIMKPYRNSLLFLTKRITKYKFEINKTKSKVINT